MLSIHDKKGKLEIRPNLYTADTGIWNSNSMENPEEVVKQSKISAPNIPFSDSG